MTLAVMGGHDGYNVQATAAIAAVTTFLILFTIFGNVLVIIAVLTSRSLKAPQNLFLVSLAAADILVATLIIPFSLANELMGYWYFDKVWCKAYLALDVLFCTASIVHLCAISLDRYWSVSQAIEYNSKRTPRRIKCTILVVWLLAALISLPPLVFNTNPSEAQEDAKRCELNEQPWYILSSSTCSFFAPCLIMILVYVRIYFIAKRRSRKGAAPKKAKAGKKLPRIQITSSPKPLAGEGEPNGHQVTVREEREPNGHHLGVREGPNGHQLIMRGEGEPDGQHLRMREEHKGHQLSLREEEHDGHQVTMREEPIGHNLRVGEEQEPIEHQLRMGEEREPNGHEVTMRDKPKGHHLRMQGEGEPIGHEVTMRNEPNGYNLRMKRGEPDDHHLKVQGDGEPNGHQLRMGEEREPNGHQLRMGEEREPNGHQLRMGEEREPNGHQLRMGEEREPNGHQLRMEREGEPNGHQVTIQEDDHPFVSQEEKKTRSPSPSQSQLGKKPWPGMETLATAKGEVLLVRRVKTLSANPWKRKTHLNREKRFTFVLAVVMGVFVVCWFPFFFLYSLRAVCSARRCPIPDVTFKFFFWIGYCNSSLNPVIYTIFNQDFRKAFRRILCRPWTQTAW
nr:PREDICTED: alpha-2B adrenergic receptor-like [Anolis carolinensis]|eukprot:XP_008122676.1 PREDICTED: alpha-2B adrenergic receptor-like [Anolis carolinensis]